MKQKSTAINGLHVDEIFTTIVGLPFIKIERKFDFNKFWGIQLIKPKILH